MVFLVNLARVVFAPLLEPLAASFEVSVGTLGVVTAAAWFGSAVPRVPTGWLLTRVSRHRVVALAGGVLFTASLATAFAPTVGALTGGAFLMGLASGAYFIAANPLVSELYPERVGRALGVHGMASQTAAVLAPLLVAAVLFLADWQLTFLLIAAAAVVATTGLLFAVRRADLPEAGTADRDLIGAVRAQWPIVLTGIVIVGSIGFVWNGLFNYYVSYLIAKGLPQSTANLLLSVVFGAGIPAFLITGRLADRFPNVPLLLGVIGSFIASVALLTLASGLVALVAVSVLLGYVIHSLFPVIDTYLLASLPDRHRASAYTAYSATMMLPQAAGSLVVGYASENGIPGVFPEALSFDQIFLGLVGCLSVVLAGLLVFYVTGRLPAGRIPSEA